MSVGSHARAYAERAASTEWGAAAAPFDGETFAASPLPMWLYHRATGRFLAVNDAAVARYGYSHEEFSRMRLGEVDPAWPLMEWRAVASPASNLSFPSSHWISRHRLNNGETLESAVMIQATESHEVGLALIVPFERRALFAALGTLLASEIRLRRLVEHLPGEVFQRVRSADGATQLSYMSPGFRRTFAVEQRGALADPEGLEHAIDERDHGRYARALERSARELSVMDIEVRLAPASSSARWVRSLSAPRSRPDGSVEWDGIVLECTARKESEQRLRRLAYRDPLTGLANRAQVQVLAEKAIARARRNSRRAALLFIDLDNFKTINDSLGHPRGDDVLVAVAARLCGRLRDGDALGRLGGDEFLVVLEDIAEPEQAMRVANDLQSALGVALTLDSGHAVSVQASVGIGLYPDDGDDYPRLLRAADSALYQAKFAEAKTRRFQPLVGDASGDRRADWSTALGEALQRDELTCVYEPMVHAPTGGIVGVVASACWRASDEQVMASERLSALASGAGLSAALSRVFLREAFAQYAVWRQGGIAPALLLVPAAIAELRSGDYITALCDALAESALSAGDVALEIPQRCLLEGGATVEDVIDSASSLGVTIVIGDFASGAVSLRHLQRLPIGGVKFAARLVGAAPRDDASAAIIAAGAAVGRALGLEISAAGVERDEQLDYLRAHGCRSYQGSLFSPPLLAPAASALLSSVAAK